jgi:hypothetical protein
LFSEKLKKEKPKQIYYKSDSIMSKTAPPSIDGVVVTLKKIKWQKFVNLCETIGADLNSPQWRFLKAVVLESSLQVYSDGEVKYVGEQEKGKDFVIPSLQNASIEMKYTDEALYPKNKTTPRKNSKSITLLNSKGTNTHTCLPQHYADYLLIVEKRGAGIISKENLQKHVIVKGDSLAAIVPTNELVMIFEPKDVKTPKKGGSDIKKRILDAIQEMIEDIADDV